MIQPTESAAHLAPPPVGLHRYLRQLLREAWTEYRRSFRRCRAQFSESSVHQLRVESRRLLALLKLLGTLVGQAHIDPIHRLIQKVLRRLARLRDTQVQLHHVERKLGSFPEVETFRKALRQRERRLIRRIGARMHRARLGKIKSAMGALSKTMGRLLADQPHESRHWEALLRSLNQAFDRVAEWRDRCHADDLETIHRLRIAFKKFRYTMELLQPVLPGVTRRELKTLQAFQNRLGQIQDAEVLVAALDQFSRNQPQHAAALIAFRRDSQRRRTLLVRAFLAAADYIHQFWLLQTCGQAGPWR